MPGYWNGQFKDKKDTLHADLFQYSSEEDVMQWLLRQQRQKLVMSFHVPLIMAMRKIDTTALYLDVHQDSEYRLRTNIYDKRGDFNFPIGNSPSIYCNIQAVPALLSIYIYIHLHMSCLSFSFQIVVPWWHEQHTGCH